MTLKIILLVSILSLGNCLTPNRPDGRRNIADLAYRGDIYAISLSLSSGGFIDEKDSFMGKYTALMVAAREGDFRLAEYLIEKGASVNARTPDGHTALMYASYNRYPEIVKLLISKGAKVDLKSTQGHTALSEILESDKQKIIQLLREAGAREEQ